jgi:nucleoside-diphosphate-sugar epimerase
VIKKNSFSKKINYNYDHVINLSGYVDHSNKIQTMKSHFDGAKNLINFFKKKKIKSFIQIGSCLEYGDIKSPQRESNLCKPKGNYGLAKLKASKYIKKIGKKFNFPYVILRLYQIYGPNQNYDRLVPFVIKSCLKNDEFACSEGSQLRDFMYVDDLTRLIKTILKKKIRQKTFNVGYGKPLPVKSVINTILNEIKYGKPEFNSIKMRKDEVKNLYPDISRVKMAFKWKPKIDFKKGIRKTIFFYKNKKIN